MKFKHFFLALLGLVLLASCKKDHSALDEARANDPWVFRSVLDSMPRMVTLAMHDKMWVAYRTDACEMYKLWRDGVKLSGAVYDTQHGPQPETKGDSWMVGGGITHPWRLRRGGALDTFTRVQYRGHRFQEGHAALMYELTTADGKVIEVTEQPEFLEKEGTKQLGFERTFTTKNVPAGAEVVLMSMVGSVADTTSVLSDGKLTWGKVAGAKKDNVSGIVGELTMALKSDGPTKVTAWLTAEPLIDNPKDDKAAADEAPGLALINKSDCKTCHNPEVKTVGPSYRAIAEKYPNTSQNVDMLVQKIMNGGAGVWGEAAMTPHPDLAVADVKEMVTYIMDMDAETDKKSDAETAMALAAPDPAKLRPAATDVNNDQVRPGVYAKIWVSNKSIDSLGAMPIKTKPAFEGVFPAIVASGGDFGELKDNFCIVATGFIKIEKDNNFLFRLNSDDGSRLTIDGAVLINNDGLHGDSDPADGEIALKAGLHPFKLEYFQRGGGKALALRWRSFDMKDFEIVPPSALCYKPSNMSAVAQAVTFGAKSRVPGDGGDEDGVHPSFDLSQARPDAFQPKVGGMDFLPDGRLVVSTWDPKGSVYILDNVQSGDPKKITVKEIAKGLAEPLGLKCVGNDIYVLQKQELTKLSDLDGDDIIDEYRTVSNAWRVSANFHEFAFGLVYKDGYFYGTLATAIQPGGASTRPQIKDRGRVVKISAKDGSVQFIAQGLRTPNGIGIGVDGELFVADNQGDWLPSSKIVHVKEGAFYGSFSVDSANQAKMKVQQPVVWLPQDEIGNSPSQPVYIDKGPYKGQMLHGEVTHGGLKRVFVEKVNGEYQGCVFRFTQGIEAGVNRVVWGPDSALYVGGIGNPGNWSHTGHSWYGLQRLAYNKKSTFEMLAVRAKSNGVEVEFTEPLAEGDGWSTADYLVKQWYYKPTPEYGGPKLDERQLKVKSATVSADRKRVFLELDGMKAGHVVYLRLLNRFVSAENHEMWATEAWYTLNAIPAEAGQVAAATATLNTLTAAETAAGWKLLFDGKTTTGWHKYGFKPVGKAWKVQDGAIMLDASKKADWQTADGGDIVTDGEYENYELRLEWKIGPCGNSGIIYNVSEDTAKYQYCWQTGPEMQVLDNACHPDAAIQKHRAGDLYDMISCRIETVKPAGEWNRVRLVVRKGHLEHWLNGIKVVETDMWTPNWKGLIMSSKFKDMKGFGTIKKGRIALQDHGDLVMYRNIKIKPL